MPLLSRAHLQELGEAGHGAGDGSPSPEKSGQARADEEPHPRPERPFLPIDIDADEAVVQRPRTDDAVTNESGDQERDAGAQADDRAGAEQNDRGLDPEREARERLPEERPPGDGRA